RQAKTSVTSNGQSPDDKQECSASTLKKQLDTTLQEKETASVLTFDQLVSQCQSAMFCSYDSKPEV
ncbi:hypothetical protein P5673_032604, partial [Acropora cervicornis]